VSGSGHVESALDSTENAIQYTYRLWAEHAPDCVECLQSGGPETGCATGQDLWRDYRGARISPTALGGAQ
jgi:hypothetical protein